MGSFPKQMKNKDVLYVNFLLAFRELAVLSLFCFKKFDARRFASATYLVLLHLGLLGLASVLPLLVFVGMGVLLATTL